MLNRKATTCAASNSACAGDQIQRAQQCFRLTWGGQAPVKCGAV
jgi:hypothetical protein